MLFLPSDATYDDERDITSCLINEVFSDVSCGVGLNIFIVRAHWGKSNDGACPNEPDNKSCRGINITEKIARRLISDLFFKLGFSSSMNQPALH